MTSDLVTALDDRIRQIVREEIARAHEGVYSSTSLPPGCPSRRAFAETCRTGRIEGAERHGAGRGTTWTVPKGSWHRARTKKPSTLRLVESPSSPTLTDAERADEMIRDAGYRLTARRST